MQGEVFSLNLLLKYVRSSEIHIWSAELDHPHQIARNWTSWSQNKACIAKLSCETCALLKYYTVLNGNFMKSGHPISPIFKGQEIQKRQHWTTEDNW